MHPMRRLLLIAVALAGLAGCGEETARVGDRVIPPPGGSLVDVMTEGDLDRIASALAAALRRSEASVSAARPMRIAPPEWRNATDLPVDRPAGFIDALTGMVNDRVGANLQFLRRPWIDDDATVEEIAAQSDYRSRLTLLPDKQRGTARLRLRLELTAPDSSGPAFLHEEVFAADPTLLARARQADRKRETRLEEARIERPTREVAETAEVRFTRDKLAERIRVSRSSARKRPHGRLEFESRLTLRAGRQRVAVQVFFYDAEGYQVEVSRPLIRELRGGRPSALKIVSQLPAERCVVLIDAD
ncbi:MAG: hypothetical protein L6Q92_16640 [Phycisphaerae bacterium]|nr:hypothetical protein [Phycisphaerae bacterium]